MPTLYGVFAAHVLHLKDAKRAVRIAVRVLSSPTSIPASSTPLWQRTSTSEIPPKEVAGRLLDGVARGTYVCAGDYSVSLFATMFQTRGAGERERDAARVSAKGL